ncbi:MAG: hypothetical protein M9887_09590 [Chitinophagales bacterium]|nr:hypothetical protein [Chitinophagales bacterium]
MLAAFTYVHVYIYYYGYGDTLRFFRFGQLYKDLLFNIQNLSFVNWLFMPNETFKNLISFQIDYAYGYDESSLFVNKISGCLSFISFNSFLVNTLIFSITSAIGLWYMFIGLYKLYPKLKIEMAVAILFVPSVVFWGSGLMKDTICIGALGFMTYNICKIFFLKNERNYSSIIFNSIMFIFCSYIISNVKIYQLLAYLPGVFIWIFYSFRDQIKNSFIRKSTTPFILILLAFMVVVGLQVFSDNLNKYALDNVVETALNLQYNLSMTDAGSAYDLGTIDPSLLGLVKKFPLAVNVSLFRPYLWEIKNPFMLLAAIESFLILIFTLLAIKNVGLFKLPNKILGSGILIFCFSFSIIFGFATGISSQNFGSLMRYKIPIMPMYLIFIFITYFNNTGKSFFENLLKNKRK